MNEHESTPESTSNTHDAALHALLDALLDAFLEGRISDDDHRRLQQLLRTSAGARSRYRERIDLEAGLRTWVADTPATPPRAERRARPSATAWVPRMAALVAFALIMWLVIVILPWTQSAIGRSQIVEFRAAGDLLECDEVVWSRRPGTGGALLTGAYSLARGVAEMRFDSGTTVLAEGPCELVVLSADEAQLGSGAVHVSVSEMSTGFSLRTPESRIINDRAVFVISIGADSTEIHVFDGRVQWIAHSEGRKVEETIQAGQARRYPRGRVERGAQVPLVPRGAVQAIRATESRIQQSAGDALVAYDGFENLAGQLRRGRSGFGWDGGWQGLGPSRGPIAEVVDSPSDEPQSSNPESLPRFSQGSEFGVDRIGKRELLLRRGEVIRRALQKPIALSNIGDTCFISFIAQRVADPSDATITNADSSFRLLLDASSTEPRHQPRPIAGVGVSTGGLPFASAGGRVRTAGGPIDASEPVLCVLRVQTLERDLRVDARFYRRGETVDRLQTSTWTISASDERPTAQISMIRLATGASAAWRIDELRVGRSWNSVITPPK